MLTAFDTDGFVLGALRAGADGFLLKTEEPASSSRPCSAATTGPP
ncbi:hypothetical protein [Nocardioides kongjuensis]